MPEPINPYAAPTASLADPAAFPVLAGRGRRLAAALLDTASVALVCLPYIALGRDSDPDRIGVSSQTILGGSISLLAALGLATYTLIRVSRHGQTLGKQLLGIRVVRSDGSPIRLARVFWLRNVLPALIGAFPLLGTAFSLVDALMIFGAECRCLHDRFADSIVVQS